LKKLPAAGGQACSRWEGEKIKPRPETQDGVGYKKTEFKLLQLRKTRFIINSLKKFRLIKNSCQQAQTAAL